ncbi:hypothetical protein HDV00_002284 [Rhizophlyctis rosea]|nr:hypothetical protein HDV00_002284 [Rhizophlyctis rosea]
MDDPPSTPPSSSQRRSSTQPTPPKFQTTNRNAAIAREYYGFVIYLSTIVGLILYLLWALLPDAILHSVGITYYPSRHWALVIPIWILGLIPFITLMFLGHNLFITPSLDSLYTITDEFANPMPASDFHKLSKDSVPDLQDIPIGVVSEYLYLPRGEEGGSAES